MATNIRYRYRSIRTRALSFTSSPVIRASLVYGLAGAGNSAIPFFLLPILTRYLSPKDYGIVAMFQVLVGICANFAGLSVHGAVARQYYERAALDFPCYVSNCVFILVGSSAATGILLWVFSGPIGHFTEFPTTWLWTVLVVSCFQFIILLLLTVWQVQMKPLPYGAFQVSQTLLNAGASLLLVVALGMGWKGRVLGQVIAYAVFTLIAVICLGRLDLLKWGLNRKYLKNALAFGVPLVPHALGMWAISVTDRILVTNLLGVAETGVYVVAAQIGMLVWLLQNSFNRAWVPYFYGELKKDDPAVRLKIVKITYAYDLLIFVFAVAFAWLASKLLGIMVGKDFLKAGDCLLWISLGYAFNGMYKMVVNYCFYVQNTSIVALVTFLTALLNVVACYVLIRVNGMIGAAQGTALAFLISFILTWIVAARVYKMPWRLKQQY